MSFEGSDKAAASIGKEIKEAYDFLDKLCSPRTRRRDRERLTKKLIKELFGDKEEE